jgi:hypothetical protein
LRLYGWDAWGKIADHFKFDLHRLNSMKMRVPGLVLLLLPCTCYAFQLPFNIPFFKSKSHVLDDLLVNTTHTPRVAIVGAGAGGTSAAFWIAKAKERFGLDVEIDVYERESHIGGSEHEFHIVPMFVLEVLIPEMSL